MQEKKTKNLLKLAASVSLFTFGSIIFSSQLVHADNTSQEPEIIDYDKFTPLALPAGQEEVIPTNTVLTKNSETAKLSLANWQDMPDGTTFVWGSKPATIINGLATGSVNVTLPDGTFKYTLVRVRIAGQKQIKLKHATYLFNATGKQLNSTILAAGSIVNINGTKDIKGHTFYQLNNQYYLPLKTFKVKPKDQLKAAKGTKRIMHSTYLYDAKSHRANGLLLKAGSYVKIQKIKGTFGQQANIHYAGGRYFYLIDNNFYVPQSNISGRGIEWSDHAATLYNTKGKKIGKIPAHTPYNTYGDPIKLNGKAYYIIGKGKMISVKF
ncbi:SLAP domain-containing protein [Lactobacillus sp. ESL0785]|uniref:SLAP domain-containing protein n=1 Tax=Lactobacillus sp. ESL0785 TaxID=2983232 RepID=UPI0023F7122F|nr:SLAP domain-containing protein [Lactobacillus sp. ESL0785]WEV70356.1 SLAP domain-containing protein [Lactobacillus sp. ESL0785]